MMQYKTVVELFQKLHLQIYASQLMTSQVIPLLFVLLHLVSVERKGKNCKILNISRTKRVFLMKGYHLAGKQKFDKKWRTQALKKLLKSNERFIMLKEVCHNLVLICIFQFVRCVVNDLEPFLNYFCQNAHLQNKGHDDALMMLFVRPDLLASTNSGHKLLKLDLKSESNL